MTGRLIDANKIKYTMLYKEDWITNTGIEKQGVWKDQIDAMPTVDAIPVEWIENIIAMAKKVYADKFAESLELMIEDWREEQRKEE